MIQDDFWNASLERLKQLMKELDCLRFYAANNNVIGYFNNLREVKKIARGFLSKTEISKLDKDWEKLKAYKIKVTDFSVSYDPNLLEGLHKLDEWLQLRLHKNGILYKGSEARKGLSRVRQKFKLDEKKKDGDSRND